MAEELAHIYELKETEESAHMCVKIFIYIAEEEDR